MYLNHRQESEPEPWSVVTRSCTLNVFHSLKEKVSEHNPGSDYVDHRNVIMNLVIHKCHFCGDVGHVFQKEPVNELQQSIFSRLSRNLRLLFLNSFVSCFFPQLWNKFVKYC